MSGRPLRRKGSRGSAPPRSEHVLCLTHGESSTLGASSDLFAVREQELREASGKLGVRSVTLLAYPDGRLSDVPTPELSRHVELQVARFRPDGLLVFDDTGVTAHPDYQAATRAAAAAGCNLPILAWSLPATIADQLRRESGQPFVGRPPGELDLCIRATRTTPPIARTANLNTVCTSAPSSLHGSEV